MQRHANRLIVAAVLIAAGVIGGFFVFSAQRRAAAIDAAARDAATRIDRLITTVGDIASSQQAYVAPGQPDEPWLERTAMLLQQFGQDAAAIRPRLQSADAAAALDEIDKGFKAVVVIDDKARQDLQESQNLLAADLIFSEGHDTIDRMLTALRGLQAAEAQAAAAQRAAMAWQMWGALGLAAAVWLAGLVVLVPLPAAPVEPARAELANVSIEPANVEAPSVEPANPESRIPGPGPTPPAIDLVAAADVCGALARATDAASLRAALGQAAAVLDARGIIIWMGAGEELFPALSYGYDERFVQRLGAIPRHASNATAEAWRTAEVRVVAGDVMSNGAVAAPVSGISGCVGVLAAEVRHGREDDPATRAVTAMIAAQLAGIVSAWPAASGSQDIHKTA